MKLQKITGSLRMRAFTLSLIALLSIQQVAEAQDEFQHKTCKAFGGLAQVVMEKRQEGVPISDLMDALVFDQKDVPRRKRNSKMIMDAYEYDRAPIAELRAKAISSFRNKYELECYAVQIVD